jgi:hypothetical protein
MCRNCKKQYNKLILLEVLKEILAENFSYTNPDIKKKPQNSLLSLKF